MVINVFESLFHFVGIRAAVLLQNSRHFRFEPVIHSLNHNILLPPAPSFSHTHT